jgi:CspA family cold shock protein
MYITKKQLKVNIIKLYHLMDYYGYICIYLTINIMQEGTVKFFNETKGFGFITPSAGGQDVFVHSTGLIDEIRENDKVEFEVENGRKGLNAVNVKVI